MMSYIFDVYYKRISAQKDFYKLALYITMFPQLVAGPIVRYQTVASEINVRSVTVVDFYEGTRRFIIGLSKKVLMADQLAIVADNIFTAQNTCSTSGGTSIIGMDRCDCLYI